MSEAAVCRCSSKQVFLKSFAIFTGKHLCWSLFFNTFASLRPATLLKKTPTPVNIANILRTSLLQNTSGGCFCFWNFCKPRKSSWVISRVKLLSSLLIFSILKNDLSIDLKAVNYFPKKAPQMCDNVLNKPLFKAFHHLKFSFTHFLAISQKFSCLMGFAGGLYEISC